MYEDFEDFKETRIKIPTKRIGNITIEYISTNKHCRIYHCRVKLADGYNSWSQEHGNSFDKTLSFAPQLISEIAGIESILIHVYNLWISKGKAFTWEEVEPRIIDILEQAHLSIDYK